MVTAVEKKVAAVKKRLRRILLIRETIRFTVLLAIPAVLLSAASKFVHPLDHWGIPVALLAAGVGIGVLTALRRKISPLHAAMVADLNGNTGESLTAYLETSARHTEFDSLIERHATQAATKLTPSEILPYRPPRRWKHLIVSLVVLIALFFVPRYQYPAEAARNQRKAYFEEAVKALEKASSIIKEKEESNPDLPEIRKKINDLKAKLNRGEIDKKKAMAEMKKISDELQKQLRQEYTKKASMDNAVEELKKDEETSSLAKALAENDKEALKKQAAEISKKIQGLAEEMKSEDAEVREEARKEMEALRAKLAKAMQEAQGKNGEQANKGSSNDGNSGEQAKSGSPQEGKNGEQAKSGSPREGTDGHRQARTGQNGKEGQQTGKGMTLPQELERALENLDKLASGKMQPGEGASKEMSEQMNKDLLKGLGQLAEAGKLSEQQMEQMIKAMEQMAKAEEEARCGPSGEG